MKKRKVAGAKVAPELVFELLKLHKLFPDAKRIQGYYDFDSNMFKLKWESEQLAEHEEGAVLPYIGVEYIETPTGPEPTKWNYHA